MVDPNIGKTLGLKDMHPVQVEALMDFVGMALNLSAISGDDEIIQETETIADELVRLFGGSGIKVTIETL